jgi:hypothetical protein
MKTPRFLRTTLVVAFIALAAEQVPAQDTLPRYITVELKRLEEMYHILDLYSTRIWPGWKNYADVPFLFTYTNGVQLLIGHPKPPDGFSLLPGVEIRGKKVFLDRRRELPIPMPLPLLGGGGPIPYGYVDGKLITVVKIGSRPLQPVSAKNDKRTLEDDYQLGSENQIVLNIHELFHCFQRSTYRSRHGNLQYNTDENYATYAEIEGLALEHSYLEADDATAREYLKDFLIARGLKRRSMTELEQLQESEEDVSEGTATYSELMAATLIKKSYTPLITRKDDPFFFGFKYVDSLIQGKLKMLRFSRTNTLSSRDKCYPYGCYQAVLLNRFAPGWQDGFFQRGRTLDHAIDSLFALQQQEREKIAARLRDRYGYDTIYTRHAQVIGERNEAFKALQSRKGLAFIVNFKNTGEYLAPESTQVAHKVGLMYIYPKGIRRIKMADVIFEGKETPMVNDQLFYVKWIDTEATENGPNYEVSGLHEGTGNTYRNAVFKTRGFTLSAPKVEIRETKNRVKVTVLAKVKE